MSMDIIPDGELPISDVRGAAPPERPYSHARHDSRNSNGGPLDDLPPYLPAVMDTRHRIPLTRLALDTLVH
jgi:hypothetical protein